MWFITLSLPYNFNVAFKFSRSVLSTFQSVDWPVNNYKFPSYASDSRVQKKRDLGAERSEGCRAEQSRSNGSLIPRWARAQYWRNVSQRHCSCPSSPATLFVSHGKNTRTHKSAVKKYALPWIRQVGNIQLENSTVWLPSTKFGTQLLSCTTLIIMNCPSRRNCGSYIKKLFFTETPPFVD